MFQTSIRLEDVTINPEYELMVPPLTDNEYKTLKESVLKNGFFERIKVNTQNQILDGHHRYRVWKETGIIPKFEVKQFDTIIDEKLYVIKSNLERRQLNDYNKTYLIEKLEALEAPRARQRQEATQLQGRNEKGDPIFGGVQMNTAEEEKGKARDLAAKTYNVSPTTYHRAKTILHKGSTELKQKVANGEASINWAYNKINRMDRHINTPDLPKGEYDVIYADPPWDYSFKFRGNPENHYPTMKTDDICKLEIPSSPNAMLFLWATNPKLEEALQVISAWGFEYKTNIVWVKDRIGTGHYVRGLHELLLICKKGSMPTPQEETRIPSVLYSPTREHSKKPDEVYGIIESMYPNRKYLELFARNEKENWTSWGNEVENNT